MATIERPLGIDPDDYLAAIKAAEQRVAQRGQIPFRVQLNLSRVQRRGLTEEAKNIMIEQLHEDR